MVRIELSDQMLAIIVDALSNHRYRDAAPVLAEMQKQVNNQKAAPVTNGKAEEVAIKD